MPNVWCKESEIAAAFVAWDLSPREQEVMLLALGGMDVSDTAIFLGVAPVTVRGHRRSAFYKAGIAESCGGPMVLMFARQMLMAARQLRRARMATA